LASTPTFEAFQRVMTEAHERRPIRILSCCVWLQVTTITDLLEPNTALEDVQHLAGHGDPRRTRLCDRRRRKVTRNMVERISISIEQDEKAP
jgi:hypothetical protein